MQIANLQMTCNMSPTQWEGTLDDGRMIYIRVREEELRIRVSPEPTKSIWDAIRAPNLVICAYTSGFINIHSVLSKARELGCVISLMNNLIKFWRKSYEERQTYTSFT